MYQVIIINDGNEIEIHNANVNGLKLESGVINKSINKIDSFDVSLFPNNPGYGQLRSFKTIIKVLNTKTGVYEFEGRVLGPTDEMSSSGLFNSSFDCEGELGYLHDSQQRHLEFRGTPLELLTQLLDYHNSQVEEYKRFEAGEMEVTTSTDNLYIYLSAESDTFEEIEDKILDRVGGELQIRKEGDIRYLDVLERIGSDKNTEIEIAKNLLSMSRDVDPTEIITRLTPLGERIESEDEEATDASEARLTIESVNNGVPYVDREDLIEEFGIQGGSETWDDITLPDRLLTSAQNWINNQKTILAQYDIEAADLALIGLDIDYFDMGNTYPVINPVMNIDERLRVVGKSTDINEPQNSSLTIGDKFKTLKEYQNEANKSAEKVVELENTVSRQSQRLSTIREEMENIDGVLEDIDQAIGDADIPALEESINNLNGAVSDLTDAVDAIPDYDPATETENGLMSATDKAKINLINLTDSINLDNLKAKLGLITVTNAIDLDSLQSRVEALENGNNEG